METKQPGFLGSWSLQCKEKQKIGVQQICDFTVLCKEKEEEEEEERKKKEREREKKREEEWKRDHREPMGCTERPNKFNLRKPSTKSGQEDEEGRSEVWKETPQEEMESVQMSWGENELCNEAVGGWCVCRRVNKMWATELKRWLGLVQAAISRMVPRVWTLFSGTQRNVSWTLWD